MRKITIFLSGLLLTGAILAGASPVFAFAQKGRPAPLFNVRTMTGRKVALADFKGSVVVVDFFASWCGPCRESIPHLVDLSRKYGRQKVQFLGLSLDDNSADLNAFIATKKISYPVAFADEDIQSNYGLHSIPTIYIIDKKGVVAEKYMGFSDEAGRMMEATINRLLAE